MNMYISNKQLEKNGDQSNRGRPRKHYGSNDKFTRTREILHKDSSQLFEYPRNYSLKGGVQMNGSAPGEMDGNFSTDATHDVKG